MDVDLVHGLVVFSLTCGGALLAVTTAVRVLRRFGVGDTPSHHSVHDHWTPRGAGIALLLVTVVVVVATDTRAVDWAGALALPLGLVGTVDDLRDLSPWTRLAWQVVVALGFLALVVGFGSEPAWLMVLSFLWIVGFVNSANFMDGINGMAGVNAAVMGGSWALVAALHGFDGPMVVGLVLAGLALGFLPHNFPRARVFLGDSGSYLLGGIGAACAVLVTIRVGIVAALLPTGLYVIDTGWTILQRLLHGEHAFKRDRDYVFHRLVTQGGLTHVQATLLVGAGTLALGLVAAWVSTTSGWQPRALALVAAAAIAGAHLRLPRMLAGRGSKTAVALPDEQVAPPTTSESAAPTNALPAATITQTQQSH